MCGLDGRYDKDKETSDRIAELVDEQAVDDDSIWEWNESVV